MYQSSCSMNAMPSPPAQEALSRKQWALGSFWSANHPVFIQEAVYLELAEAVCLQVD